MIIKFIALKSIYIIDYTKWTKKVKIPFSNRIIKNSYYLNEFSFLLFFEDFDNRDYDDFDFPSGDEEIRKPEDNIGIMKIFENVFDSINSHSQNLLYLFQYC